MLPTLSPNVARFEKAVSDKQYETACVELLRILEKIDDNFGGIQDIEFAMPVQIARLEKDQMIYFCTRMAAAITVLFSDPALEISKSGAQQFFALQRWLAVIFASSPYVNADHILQKYNQNPDKTSLEVLLRAEQSELIKFCILYFPESNLVLDLNALWEIDPQLCSSLCFALQSPRFIGTDAAFAKRHTILQWFPEKLSHLQNLNEVPGNIAHDVYVHCSYDSAASKHAVKKPLNQVIRRHLLECGCTDRDISKIGYRNNKPVMVVLLEYFHSAHAVFRSHALSLQAARERFYVIGVGNENTDQAGRGIFDEFHVILGDSVVDKLHFLREICEYNGAAVLYMPSVGMNLLTIAAANLRYAAIQAAALGHPATTYSEFIDFIVAEEDYIGSEGCFSETVLRLPKGAMPYAPITQIPQNMTYRLRENPETVHIGIALTAMQFNPKFIEALKIIQEDAKVKIHYHFALTQFSGIMLPYIERFLRTYLGDAATLHPYVSQQQYFNTLHRCDMMLNPFPFGNHSGIIDMMMLGLIGICETGYEPHQYMDAALFKQLGIPEWLIARTVDQYIEHAILLAENHADRLAWRRHLIRHNKLESLFDGNPSPLGNALYGKLKEWEGVNHFSL